MLSALQVSWATSSLVAASDSGGGTVWALSAAPLAALRPGGCVVRWVAGCRHAIIGALKQQMTTDDPGKHSKPTTMGRLWVARLLSMTGSAEWMNE
jgi:hypothetical protein